MPAREYRNTGDRHELVWECSRLVADFEDATRALMARNELRRRLDGRGIRIDHVAPGESAAMPVSLRVRVIDLPGDRPEPEVPLPPKATPEPEAPFKVHRGPTPDREPGPRFHPPNSTADRSPVSWWRVVGWALFLASTCAGIFLVTERNGNRTHHDRLRKEKTPAQTLSDADLRAAIQRQVSVSVRPYLVQNADRAARLVREIHDARESSRHATADALPGIVERLGRLHGELAEVLAVTAGRAPGIGRELDHCRRLALDRAGELGRRELQLKLASSRERDALASVQLYEQAREAIRQQEIFLQLTSAVERIQHRVVQSPVLERPAHHRTGLPVHDLRGLFIHLAGFHHGQKRACDLLAAQNPPPSPEGIRAELSAAAPSEAPGRIRETVAELEEEVTRLEDRRLPTPLTDPLSLVQGAAMPGLTPERLPDEMPPEPP